MLIFFQRDDLIGLRSSEDTYDIFATTSVYRDHEPARPQIYLRPFQDISSHVAHI